MKNMTILFAILILIWLSAVSCSNTQKTDKSADELMSAVLAAVPLEAGYYTVSEAYFDYYFDAEGVLDWSVVRSKSQSSENEIGVLVAESGRLEEVRSRCSQYLEEQRIAYLEAKAAYTPEEYEKYRDAEVLVYGNCVVYFILGNKDRASAISAVETCLSD